ncbi:hypothetical protein [Microbacterium oleivorans]|uniref:Uncharacterized protein n=1 Tax=Microbacterium oleivorans TaxID=273677 RepID=A0A7D5EXH9_9MICO|nr:hypothetical protein [Microbacterium oleivorans]QLD12104.1 hypothetical protein HW566_10210 [Microbacterium oleivorans]
MIPADSTSAPRRPRPGTGVVWARVEDGFHVGSRDGDFVGYIDRLPDGRYEAYDSRSQSAGTFVELTAAMRALATPPARGAADEPPIELREVR